MPACAVGAEGQRPDVAGVPWQPRHFLAPRQVPQPDRPVAAGRGQAPAIGVEGRGEDLVGVPAQYRHAPLSICHRRTVRS